MAYLYVQNRFSETPISEKVDEVIPEGDLVVLKEGGGAALADYNTATRVTGIALNFEAGDSIASHEYDYQSGIDSFNYQPSSDKDSHDMFPNTDDRVPVRGRHVGAHLYPRTTVESNSGITSSPSIDYMDVVGVVDTSVADAPDAAGMIVEEGYSNDENDDAASTTFNRSNNNFIALGRAVNADENWPVTSFDERVWVERTPDV